MGTHEHHDHGHGHGHGQGPGHDDDAALAEVLDLDAEVLSGHLEDVTAWVAQHLTGPSVVADLGAGTGTGTVALLHRFPDARVIAVDVSAGLLDRLRRRTTELDLADRVEVRQADLDTGWPDLADLDLVWASASMHHLADPDAVLARVLDALRPGGALVVLELDGFPRFLPDDLGHGAPGLEARVHDVLAAARARDLPLTGSDWGARLEAAGFAVESREFSLDLGADVPPATSRYARASLGRLRTRLADGLSAEDLATLDVLLAPTGPASLLERGDLTVRAHRSVWIATRP